MLTTLLYVLGVSAKNYGVLLNSSRGFHNYRHMANVCVFHRTLRENGFCDDDIVVLSYENQIEDVRNVDKRFVYLDDSWRIPYSHVSTTRDAFETFLNTLEGNNHKLKDADESSNVLIYMCGHGNDCFLKFGDMFYMTRDDLMPRLFRLASRVNRVLLILDTCQAEALVDRTALPENVFIMTTSVKGESSISSFSSSLISVNVVDNFPHFFLKRIENGFDKKTHLVKLFSDLSQEPICSKLTFSTDRDFTFEEFFVQNLAAQLLPFK